MRGRVDGALVVELWGFVGFGFSSCGIVIRSRDTLFSFLTCDCTVPVCGISLEAFGVYIDVSCQASFTARFLPSWLLSVASVAS